MFRWCDLCQSLKSWKLKFFVKKKLFGFACVVLAIISCAIKWHLPSFWACLKPTCIRCFFRIGNRFFAIFLIFVTFFYKISHDWHSFQTSPCFLYTYYIYIYIYEYVMYHKGIFFPFWYCENVVFDVTVYFDIHILCVMLNKKKDVSCFCHFFVQRCTGIFAFFPIVDKTRTVGSSKRRLLGQFYCRQHFLGMLLSFCSFELYAKARRKRQFFLPTWYILKCKFFSAFEVDARYGGYIFYNAYSTFIPGIYITRWKYQVK